MKVSKKHLKTLQMIFQTPVRSDVKWDDIEKLLVACGAELYERRGSRICIKLNNEIAVFHRPHPRKETNKGALKSMKLFLIKSGIKL